MQKALQDVAKPIPIRKNRSARAYQLKLPHIGQNFHSRWGRRMFSSTIENSSQATARHPITKQQLATNGKQLTAI